jgi:hypothetical protein
MFVTGLEPRDVGPRFGGDRPVSEVDRALVVDLLGAAAADGRLAPDDTARRRALAQRAQTFDDLIPLTRDLMPVASAPGLAAAPPTGLMGAGTPGAAVQSTPGGAWPATPREAAGPGATLVGVFGASIRKGAWSAPATIRAVAAFGGDEIDLTEAIWEAPTIELTAHAVFGGIEIKVPAGTEVVNHATSVFGGVDIKGLTGGTNGRRVVIKGFCVFGGVSVKGV